MKRLISGFIVPCSIFLILVSNAFSNTHSSHLSPPLKKKSTLTGFSIGEFLQIDPAGIRVKDPATFPSGGNLNAYAIKEAQQGKYTDPRTMTKNVTLPKGTGTLSVFTHKESGTAGTILVLDSKDSSYQCKDILKEAIQKYGKPILHYVDDSPLLYSHMLFTTAVFEFPSRRTDFVCMDFQHFTGDAPNAELKESTSHGFFATGSKTDIAALQKRTLIQCDVVSSIENSSIEDTNKTFYFYVDPNMKALRRRDSSILFSTPQEFNDQKIYIHQEKGGKNSDTDVQLKLDRVTGEMLMRAETPKQGDMPKIVVNYRGNCKPVSEEKKF